jgi:hypothetical protein
VVDGCVMYGVVRCRKVHIMGGGAVVRLPEAVSGPGAVSGRGCCCAREGYIGVEEWWKACWRRLGKPRVW